MREKGVPEKYVRIVKNTYVEARTKVKSSVGLTSMITIRVELRQGSSLSPYLFDLVMGVLGRGSMKKTDYWSSSEQQDLVIRLEGEEVKRVKTFKYLGSTLAEDGELDAIELNHRVRSGWRN